MALGDLAAASSTTILTSVSPGMARSESTVADTKRCRKDEKPYYDYVRKIWLEKVYPKVKDVPGTWFLSCPFCEKVNRTWHTTGIGDEVRKTSMVVGEKPLPKKERARKSFVKHVGKYHVDQVCRLVYPKGTPPITWFPKAATVTPSPSVRP